MAKAATQLELHLESFDGPLEPLISTAPAALAPLGPEALLSVWRRFAAAASPPSIEMAGVPRASVEERRASILDALRSSRQVSFRALAGDTIDQVIATFLA